MRYFMLFSFLIFFISPVFSQTAQEEIDQNNQFLATNSGQLVLTLRNYDTNTQGELKDEFLQFNEKINSLSLDEEKQIMTIHYKRFLKRDEIQPVLDKYGIRSTDVEFKN